MLRNLVMARAIGLFLAAGSAGCQASRPLPSWRDGPAREALLEFVERVTRPGSPEYVPPAERIAVFDNDGTLWAEQPIYFQAAFAFDRVKALAPQHPEWKEQQPFRALLEGDLEAALSGGEKSLLEIVMATHAGMTTEAFEEIVREWIASARHPRFDRPYRECAYQPMLELLEWLRAHEFETWIVSGGGIEFMRPWVEEVYGIPPQQVIGSSVKLRYELRESVPVLVRLPEIDFVDDKEGKPVGIHRHIGKRPIAAFGNSDGDLAMLEWVTAGTGARLGLFVHHTDREREWAYDRDSSVGKLDRGLERARERGWVVVDMGRDWSRVFAFESR